MGLIFLRLIQAALFILPRPLCLLLGRGLGLAFYRMDRKRRHIALSNLRLAFSKELSEKERRRIARRSFSHFGRTIVDILKLSLKSGEKISRLITVEGEDFLLNALQEKKGILMFSAHYGNWEVAPLLISRHTALHVIARPLDSPRFEAEVARIRSVFQSRVIHKQQASKDTLRALRNNEMVAILIDQNVLRKEAVFVDFFGLATFFLRTQAPILPVFCFPRGRRYVIQIGEPLSFLPSGDMKKDIQNITQTCTQIIEEQIRHIPEYWLWFHDRWRSRPEPPV